MIFLLKIDIRSVKGIKCLRFTSTYEILSIPTFTICNRVVLLHTKDILEQSVPNNVLQVWLNKGRFLAVLFIKVLFSSAGG